MWSTFLCFAGQHISSSLITYSSSSGSSGSNEFIPGMKDLRRSTSQNSVPSSFQSNVYANVWKVSLSFTVNICCLVFHSVQNTLSKLWFTQLSIIFANLRKQLQCISKFRRSQIDISACRKRAVLDEET